MKKEWKIKERIHQNLGAMIILYIIIGGFLLSATTLFIKSSKTEAFKGIIENGKYYTLEIDNIENIYDTKNKYDEENVYLYRYLDKKTNESKVFFIAAKYLTTGKYNLESNYIPLGGFKSYANEISNLEGFKANNVLNTELYLSAEEYRTTRMFSIITLIVASATLLITVILRAKFIKNNKENYKLLYSLYPELEGNIEKLKEGRYVDEKLKMIIYKNHLILTQTSFKVIDLKEIEKINGQVVYSNSGLIGVLLKINATYNLIIKLKYIKKPVIQRYAYAKPDEYEELKEKLKEEINK